MLNMDPLHIAWTHADVKAVQGEVGLKQAGRISNLIRENEQHRVLTSPDLDETIRATSV